MRNPVKRHMHKSVRPSVVAHKKTSLKSEASLRDAAQSLSEEIVENHTFAFTNHGVVYWDESEDCLQGCLNDVGSSSISIDCEEDLR